MKQLKAKHDYMCLKSILEDVCFLEKKKKTTTKNKCEIVALNTRYSGERLFISKNDKFEIQIFILLLLL